MKLMKCLWFLIFLFQSCLCQDYGFIDDIPIENYDPAERQENDMDLELLPRRDGRSFSSDEDPKELFFRSIRVFGEGDGKLFESNDNLPRPSFSSVLTSETRRKKRSSDDPPIFLEQQSKSLNGIVKTLGKPLEIMPLDTKNLSESRTIEDDQITANSEMSINDFIRFRRSPVDEIEKKMLSVSPKNDHILEKLVMIGPDQDNLRKSREISNEPWSKHDYSVQKNDDFTFDDNIPSSSENVRIPRVNFVTQKFTDNGPASSVLRSLGREPRARNLDREMGRDVGRDDGFYEGRMKLYDRMRPYYRDDPYRYDSHEATYSYDPRFENYYRSGLYYPTYTQKPQKRIIYYATLPEISRNSPNSELRNRYRYDRDMYDDRYLNEPFRGRKGYPKSRYEDDSKIPYPVKVSTDVNVREVKKNPERRIYSDVDRPRYAYNTPPYHGTDG